MKGANSKKLHPYNSVYDTLKKAKGTEIRSVAARVWGRGLEGAHRNFGSDGNNLPLDYGSGFRTVYVGQQYRTSKKYMFLYVHYISITLT